MSIIVGYAVRGGGLALTETVSRTGVRVELERTVAAGADRPSLVVCVETGDPEAFDAALREDATVTDVRALGDVEGARLYAMRAATGDSVVPTRRGAERLLAVAEDDWWHALVRFPDREAFSSYRESLSADVAEFRLDALYEDRASVTTGAELTGPQRETLELAYRGGYFDVPRRMTTTDLAEQLDISDQAVSERLRRGHARLVERVVGVE